MGNCSAKGCLTLNPWLVKASSNVSIMSCYMSYVMLLSTTIGGVLPLDGAGYAGVGKGKEALDGMAAMLLTDM